jgi:hypothetical protein
MAHGTDSAQATHAPDLARAQRQPKSVDPQTAAGPHSSAQGPLAPPGLSGAGRPAAEKPDLLLRLPLPLLQPALIRQMQRVQGNRHVARALAQPGAASRQSRVPNHQHPVIARAQPDPAAPVPEPAPAAPEGAAPQPVTPEQAALAQTQAILNQSFGKIKPIEIPPGEIVLLDDQEALWAKHDRYNKGKPNPFNGGQPWSDGDSKKYQPGLTGFALWGTIFVNKQKPLGTAVVHEMLHLNAADGFAQAVGRALDEGTTQWLTVTALTAAHIPIDEGVFYPMETSWVNRLIELLGEDTTLINAYFRGADTLIAKVDALKGAGTFARLKDLLARWDQDKEPTIRDEARKLLEPVSAAPAPVAPAPQP